MFAWTETDDLVIEAMIREQKPMSAMAQVIGASRNAIAGRISRLRKQHPGRFEYPEKIDRTKFADNPAGGFSKITMATSKPKPAPRKLAVMPVYKVGLTITDIGFRQCKWPVATDSDGIHLFCGDATGEAQVYCAAHRLIAHRKSS